MSKRISRRQFISNSAATSATLPVLAAQAAQEKATPALQPQGNPSAGNWLHWLDDHAPSIPQGVTWGTPWPRGQQRQDESFALRSSTANKLTPLQSWPLAYWPDGSLKWTAHALPPGTEVGDGPFEVVAQKGTPKHAAILKVTESDAAIEIDTGKFACRLNRSGTNIIGAINRAGRETLRDGKLVLLRQDRGASTDGAVVTQESFESAIEKVTLEQNGPLRAVVKVEGKHAHGQRQWLPFTLRFYFYAGGEALRVLHTIVFDGDEDRDFIRGIGLRFSVPLSDPLHDRHIRFVAENEGLFAEAVRGLTGLRRDSGKPARDAQLAGIAAPAISPSVDKLLEYIPAFGDWTLLQPNADSFTIRKRTADGHAWLDSSRGRRASGLGVLGGPSGAVAFGIRNFWQSHPAQLDIRQAHENVATVTMWVWAPDVAPMDLRFYHDGLGQDTYEKQYKGGLEITYEDYEPGFGTPKGVARTSEMMLWILPATPARALCVELAAALAKPAVMTPTPQTSVESGVFGHGFSLPSQTPPEHAQVEQHMTFLFDFYRGQQEQRSWYGFWNYGDVMHSYDFDRHEWKYDVGGFAWDNSELSTDIWLWLYYLRSGRADVFRFAEAMTRHTGEVDVHHLGRFAPLGSRHNVMHWGCSAKQLRISTALNRRYYYYLTADERVGDLMREQIEAGRALRTIQPGRKLASAMAREHVDPDGDFAYLGFGTDWGSLAGAWLTEWERTRNPQMRDRLLASMRTIGAQPRGFFTGGERMNLITGAFDISKDSKLSVSHLSAAFGLPEVCAELIELLNVPEFENAWLQYCELYNASEDAQKKALGESLGALNLQQGHSRLTAFAAYRKKDAALAARAWQEFDAGRAGYSPRQPFATIRIEAPAVMNAVDELPGGSSNATAQWGIAAIACLAYTRK
ncbi:MAG: Tat pathway signal sequence domain protein [Pseudomonadota bacterium]